MYSREKSHLVLNINIVHEKSGWEKKLLNNNILDQSLGYYSSMTP